MQTNQFLIRYMLNNLLTEQARLTCRPDSIQVLSQANDL